MVNKNLVIEVLNDEHCLLEGEKLNKEDYMFHNCLIRIIEKHGIFVNRVEPIGISYGVQLEGKGWRHFDLLELNTLDDLIKQLEPMLK